MAACLRQEQAANLYSDKRSAVDASRSARDSLQLISQPLRATKSVSTNLTSTLTEVTINVVPLGSFLGGCPPPLVTFPATRLGFLRATWLTTSGSSLVVATRFYPGAQKTFRSSWQAFRLQLRASIASANRSAFTLSQSLATPFADPFVGLKDRNLRDAESYTEKKFPGQSLCLLQCFIFTRKTFCLSPIRLRASHFFDFLAEKTRNSSNQTFTRKLFSTIKGFSNLFFWHLMVTETGLIVVVNHADCLQERITNSGPDKVESPALQIKTESVGKLRTNRNRGPALTPNWLPPDKFPKIFIKAAKLFLHSQESTGVLNRRQNL
jgi:hypothetical protein